MHRLFEILNTEIHIKFPVNDIKPLPLDAYKPSRKISMSEADMLLKQLSRLN